MLLLPTMMEPWGMNSWIVIGGLLLAVQVEQSYLQPISGPNVCGAPFNTRCCPGWQLHPALQKCVVPTCDQDCGEGYCQKPNLCFCPNGELSIAGCSRDGDNVIPGGHDSGSSDECNPRCINRGQCRDGNKCVCPYGFMGQTCDIDYRTGPCFASDDRGTCSDPVAGLRSTKALCCATVGQGWGNTCESCSNLNLQCPKGFISDQRTGECLDVDECVVIPGLCERGTCENTVGSFTCEATGMPFVYNLTEVNQTGNIIGPCFTYENARTCSLPVEGLLTTKEICCATIGQGWGESCESCSTVFSHCMQGYIVNDLTGRCTDVNECNLMPQLCRGGTCHNTPGAFLCEAKGTPVSSGSSGGRRDTGLCFTYENGGICSLEVTGFYTSKELCCTTIGKGWGTYELCESCLNWVAPCDIGFIQVTGTTNCVDVNECGRIPGLCQGGICRNTEGAFTCEAKGTPVSSSPSGGPHDEEIGPCFTHENAGTCSLPIEGLFTTKEICCATIGQGWGESCESCSTFNSRCLQGYIVKDVTRKCVDVNECDLMPQLCHGGTCRNTQGAFVCEAKGTPISSGSSGGRRDTGLCFTYENGGICSLEVTGFYTSKELCCTTIGKGWGTYESCESCLSVYSPCEKGFIQVTGTTDCTDVNECGRIPGLCQGGTCRNTEGAFTCEAKGIPISSGPSQATGPCFRHKYAGVCSLPVEGLFTTKEICCATIGQGWGESCESCSTFNSHCVQGYIVSDLTGRCTDVNECDLMPELCRGGTCHNTPGAFLCEAKGTPISSGSSGGGHDTGLCFTYENGGICSLEVTGFYTSKELCCTTIGKGWGTYDSCESCLSVYSPCEKGFIQVSGTTSCVDVNECAVIPELCQGGTCHNTKGAFLCEAKGTPSSSGLLDGVHGNATCFTHENAGICSLPVEGLITTKEICCATIGQGWGESCESCSTFNSRCVQGYIVQDGTRKCVDVNECDLMPELCNGGTCNNTPGAFECEAKGTPISSGPLLAGGQVGLCFTYENGGICSLEVTGFYNSKQLCCGTIGKGWGNYDSCESCLNVYSPCEKGFIQVNGTTDCTDVNECDLIPSLCGNGKCTNTEGAFLCEAKGIPLSAVDQGNTSEFEFIEEDVYLGQDGIRLMRMHHQGNVSFIREFEVNMNLKLASHQEDEQGDNNDVIGAESMKKEVYVLAKENGVESAEQFALDICQTQLDSYSQVVSCKVYVEEAPWRRIDQSSQEYTNAFIHNQEATRFTEVFHQRNESPKLWGGLKDMTILKPSEPGSAGSVQDSFLSEATDSVLHMVVWCKWLYSNPDGISFDQPWEKVKNKMLDTILGPPVNTASSPRQSTAYQTAHAILREVSEVDQVAVEIPIFYYYPAKIDTENNEIFVPSEKTTGLVHAALKRQQN